MKAEEEEKKNETQTRNKKKKLEKNLLIKKTEKLAKAEWKREKKKNCLKKGNIRFAWQTVRSCAVSGFNREVWECIPGFPRQNRHTDEQGLSLTRRCVGTEASCLGDKIIRNTAALTHTVLLMFFKTWHLQFMIRIFVTNARYEFFRTTDSKMYS